MKKYRVAEVFGPTIQGEGRQAGLPCYFVRFGGCDLRCTWCDTPHSVLPEYVRQLPQKTTVEIIEELRNLVYGPEWVVITGGNPALLDLGGFVDALTQNGYKSMVETQGTRWNDWLNDVDELCISPKPPSSTNTVEASTLKSFLSHVKNTSMCYLKVVVFDRTDYAYARDVHHDFPYIDMYLSVGTHDPYMPTVGNPHPDDSGFGGVVRGIVRDTVGHDYRLLAERVAGDTRMRDVKVLPQLHVVAWGNERGH